MRCLGFALILGTGTIASTAFAQQATEEAPSPPATEEAPKQAAPPVATIPGSDEEWDADEEAEAEDEDEARPKGKKKKKKKKRKELGEYPTEENAGRFRGGVSGNLGAFVPGPIVLLGAEGRFGYQINDMLAAYGGIGAMAGLGFGVGVSDTGGSGTISLGAALAFNAMFEATFANVFFVAAGPQILWGSFVSESIYADTQAATGVTASVFSGILPGLKARIGVGFGKEQPSRRKQFTLAFDASLMFGQRYLVVNNVTPNGEANVLVEDGIAVGFIPALSLGFDAK